MQLYWISTHFQLFITDFAKIISYLSGSRNSLFQGTPLNDCFQNNSSTRVVKIWKWLQNVSVEQCGGAFRKSYWKKLRNFPARNVYEEPLFSKATCGSTKKGFLHILFPWKFRKMSRKKQKLSEKLLAGLVSMNIFIDTF